MESSVFSFKRTLGDTSYLTIVNMTRESHSIDLAAAGISVERVVLSTEDARTEMKREFSLGGYEGMILAISL